MAEKWITNDNGGTVEQLYVESLETFNDNAHENGYRKLRTCSRCSTVGLRFGICPQSTSRYIPDEGIVEFEEHDDRCPLDESGSIKSTDCVLGPWIPDYAIYQGVLRSSNSVICFLFRVDTRLYGIFHNIDFGRVLAVLDLDRQYDDLADVVLAQSALSSNLEYVALLAQTNYQQWTEAGVTNRPTQRAFNIYILHATRLTLPSEGPTPVSYFDRILYVYSNIETLDYQIVRLAFIPGYPTEHFLVCGTRNWPIPETSCQLSKLHVTRRRVAGVLQHDDDVMRTGPYQVQQVSFGQDGALCIVCVSGVVGTEYIVLHTVNLHVITRLVNSLPPSLFRPLTHRLPCFVNCSPSVSSLGRQFAIVRFDSMTRNCATSRAAPGMRRLAAVYQLPQCLLPLRSICKLLIQSVAWQTRDKLDQLPLPRSLRNYLSDI